jgi:hypothetical protein
MHPELRANDVSTPRKLGMQGPTHHITGNGMLKSGTQCSLTSFSVRRRASWSFLMHSRNMSPQLNACT